MSLYRDDNYIVSVQIGDIDGDYELEKVVLMATPFETGSSYIQSAELIIEKKNKPQENIKLDIIGYDLDLILEDFTGDNNKEILIRGAVGGPGGYVFARIYKYEEGTLKLIFDEKTYAKNISYQSRYLDDYKIQVVCKNTNRSFEFDISKEDKELLNLIYDKNGNFMGDSNPYVSQMNTIYPVKPVDQKYYSLMVQQKVSGFSKYYLLAGIETMFDIDENGNMSIVYQYGLTKGSKVNLIRKKAFNIENRIPKDAQIISLDKFGGKNGIIEMDINNDGNNEILYAYNYKGYSHIGIGALKGRGFEIIDEYKGTGYDIDYISLDRVCSSKNKNIIVGWKIRDLTSRLDILEFADNKIKSRIPNTILCFNKIDVINMKKKKSKLRDIVLWNKNAKQEYEINIYKWVKGKLIEIDKYNKYYYSNILKYYDKLMKTKKDSMGYLYNRAKAQYIVSEYNEALKIINKALDLKIIYPSIKELEDFKNILEE